MTSKFVEPSRSPLAFYREIEELDAALKIKKMAYLRRFGWDVTSITPGSIWLMRRDFGVEDTERKERWLAAGPGPKGWPSEPQPYGVITVPVDIAVQMTATFLDPMTEDDPHAR
ncbi:MAG: hypothetical protein COC10_09325 [Sphingobium sp.]|jgi:hypothetical protein|nr:MAG: hypothetical protein COC10_09325 [Sphingobium sp.]